MPFTDKQKRLIERHLYLDETEEEQPTATLEVTRRDLRFLLQAIQYYHDTCCPGEGRSEACDGLTWGEDVHSGALETFCMHRCEDWIDEMLSPKVLATFPTKGSR